MLATIRNSGAYYGEPLHICKRCNDSVEENKQELIREREKEKESVQAGYMMMKIFLSALAVAVLFAWIWKRFS